MRFEALQAAEKPAMVEAEAEESEFDKDLVWIGSVMVGLQSGLVP